MERLLRKFETAKTLVPRRSSHEREAADAVRRHLFRLDQPGDARGGRARWRQTASISIALRVRGFPVRREVIDFIAAHEQIFLVEQNRDAQLRTLLINECGIDPAKLTPSCIMTARRSRRASSPRAIAERLAPLNVAPLRKAAS